MGGGGVAGITSLSTTAFWPFSFCKNHEKENDETDILSRGGGGGAIRNPKKNRYSYRLL